MLDTYLSGIPLAMVERSDFVYGFEVVQTSLVFDTRANGSDQIRAPLLSNYDNF
jgi:hypothetical protein